MAKSIAGTGANSNPTCCVTSISLIGSEIFLRFRKQLYAIRRLIAEMRASLVYYLKASRRLGILILPWAQSQLCDFVPITLSQP